MQEQGDHAVPRTQAKGNGDNKGDRDPCTNNARRRSHAQVDDGEGQRPISKEQGYCLYTSAQTKGNRDSHPWRPASKQTCAAVLQEEKRGSKETMDQYFGGGERVPPPSKGGTPVQSILVRHATKTPESTTGTKDAVGSQPEPTLPETKGKGKTTAAKTMEVNLEGFNPGVRSKGNGSRKRDKKGNEESKTKEQSKKTGARKQKIAFGPTEVVKEKPFTYKECVVGFAIRVDKGNNAKQAFDKKLMEGLKFIQQYVDKRACFLPHDKDKKLDPIRAKNDMPKYQVVIKGYFRIPNNNLFSNIQQENGRVVKGSGIMGFELDPQQCLEEASGDLRAMGCSIFFKKCQEVDTVPNFVFLVCPTRFLKTL